MARILVVDDDADVRRAVVRLLTAAGHEVAQAEDGAAALAAYRAHSADLIITDMYMPAVDGVEVVARLLDEFPKARLIVMSGGGQVGKEDVLDLARRLGARRTLTKPIDRQELLEAVAEALRG
jgi:two-component system KDP operon response regulator KdpE